MIKININEIEEWDQVEQIHLKYVMKRVEGNKKLEELFPNIKTYIESNIDKIAIGKVEDLKRIIFEINNLITDNVHKDDPNNKIKYDILQLNNDLTIFNFVINNKIKMKNIISKINKRFKSIEYKNSKDIIEYNLSAYKGDNIEEFIEQYYPIVWKFYCQNTIMQSIFNYKEFYTGLIIDGKRWNRHALISSMNIQVCPYCNRQYITSYADCEINEEKTTADLDHFYAKSIYPISALSLYNFIPSCTICNSRFKLDKDFFKEPHIYPYKEGFDDYKAVFKIKNYKTKNKRISIEDIIGETGNFTIEITNDLQERKIENSKKTFKLEEIYQSHKGYVKDIMKKAYWYNEDYRKQLMNDCSKLFKSERQLLTLLYGEYILDKNENKYPLTKLTRDIFEQEVDRDIINIIINDC